MRVHLGALEDPLVPGEAVTVPVEVTNNLAVIDGVLVSLDTTAGLTWRVEPELLALFPDGTGTAMLTIAAPPSLAAGVHEVPVHARSSADPSASTIAMLSVQVQPTPSLTLRVTPADRTSRHQTSYKLTCENTGNTALDVDLAASDLTHALRFALEPPTLTIGPGQAADSTLSARCRRRIMGPDITLQAQVVASAPDAQAETGIVFRHHPLVPRGAKTVVILAAIIAVWAGVIVVALNHALHSSPPQKVVPASFYAPNKTGSDPPPAGAVPKNGLDVAAGGTLTGVVDAASTGSGVGRITVQAYAVQANGRAVLQASSATQSDGAWSIPGLLPGPYRIELSAQGFETEWYPAAPSEAAATVVQVHGPGKTAGLHAVIRGLPGTITGSVVTGETPPPTVTVTVTPVHGTTHKPVAVVTTTTTGGYTVSGVPTPNTYDLSFTAPGYKPGSDTEVLTGGEHDIANSVTLRAQTGSISGNVTGAGKPLGGVQVQASANGHTFETTTPTSGAVGSFVLANLPSPATYLITFSAPGYGNDIVAQQLGPGQALTGLSVTLSGGAGDVSGIVSAKGGGPLGAVTVTVTGAPSALSTQTLTAGTVGSYRIAGLPTPGHYTLTYSLAGYTSVTVPVDLGSGASASGVDVTLPPSNGAIDGTVEAAGAGVAGATVSVTDGGPPLTTVSTTDPSGSFSLSGIAAGTYSVTASLSGYQSETVQVQVVAGETARPTIDLSPS